MKKIISCFLALTIGIALCGCGKNYDDARIGLALAAADIDAEAAIENGDPFIYDLSAGLIRGGETNALASPLTVMYALAMAANGAAGNTLTEIENALGADMDTVNEYLLAATRSIRGGRSDTKVNLAGSVWIKDSYRSHVKGEYLAAISRYYEPEIFAVPFDKSGLNRINSWVKDATGGQIKRMVESFSDNAAMEIVSALFIKGRWQSIAHSVHRDTFKNADGSDSSADYFYGTSALYESDAAYCIKRYLEGRYCFAAIMPKGDIGEYIETLDGNELQEVLSAVNPRGATYDLPEFGAEYSASIVPALKAMGINDAFSPLAADFSALTDSPAGMYISSASMKATISVNRRGLKASAAVVLEGAGSAAPDEEPLHIDFNKPFLYLVLSPEEAPLFIGKLTKI